MRTRIALAPILGLGIVLTSCTSVVGAGVVAVVAGAAVLASDCSDFVDITVRDGLTGGRTCEATVTVAKDGDQERIMPCYHARLGEGTWQVRATLPGRADGISSLVIQPRSECVHTVQTVELWLQPPGLGPQTQMGLRPGTTPLRPRPTPPPESAPLPPPPSAPSAPPTPTTTPTPSAGPGSGGPIAPIQRFPDAVDAGK